MPISIQPDDFNKLGVQYSSATDPTHQVTGTAEKNPLASFLKYLDNKGVAVGPHLANLPQAQMGYQQTASAHPAPTTVQIFNNTGPLANYGSYSRLNPTNTKVVVQNKGVLVPRKTIDGSLVLCEEFAGKIHGVSEPISPEHVARLKNVFEILNKYNDLVVLLQARPKSDQVPQQLEQMAAQIDGLIGLIENREFDLSPIVWQYLDQTFGSGHGFFGNDKVATLTRLKEISQFIKDKILPQKQEELKQLEARINELTNNLVNHDYKSDDKAITTHLADIKKIIEELNALKDLYSDTRDKNLTDFSKAVEKQLGIAQSFERVLKVAQLRQQAIGLGVEKNSRTKKDEAAHFQTLIQYFPDRTVRPSENDTFEQKKQNAERLLETELNRLNLQFREKGFLQGTQPRDFDIEELPGILPLFQEAAQLCELNEELLKKGGLEFNINEAGVKLLNMIRDKFLPGLLNVYGQMTPDQQKIVDQVVDALTRGIFDATNAKIRDAIKVMIASTGIACAPDGMPPFTIADNADPTKLPTQQAISECADKVRGIITSFAKGTNTVKDASSVKKFTRNIQDTATALDELGSQIIAFKIGKARDAANAEIIAAIVILTAGGKCTYHNGAQDHADGFEFGKSKNISELPSGNDIKGARAKLATARQQFIAATGFADTNNSEVKAMLAEFDKVVSHIDALEGELGEHARSKAGEARKRKQTPKHSTLTPDSSQGETPYVPSDINPYYLQTDPNFGNLADALGAIRSDNGPPADTGNLGHQNNEPPTPDQALNLQRSHASQVASALVERVNSFLRETARNLKCDLNLDTGDLFLPGVKGIEPSLAEVKTAMESIMALQADIAPLIGKFVQSLTHEANPDQQMIANLLQAYNKVLNFNNSLIQIAQQLAGAKMDPAFSKIFNAFLNGNHALNQMGGALVRFEQPPVPAPAQPQPIQPAIPVAQPPKPADPYINILGFMLNAANILDLDNAFSKEGLTLEQLSEDIPGLPDRVKKISDIFIANSNSLEAKKIDPKAKNDVIAAAIALLDQAEGIANQLHRTDTEKAAFIKIIAMMKTSLVQLQNRYAPAEALVEPLRTGEPTKFTKILSDAINNAMNNLRQIQAEILNNHAVIEVYQDHCERGENSQAVEANLTPTEIKDAKMVIKANRETFENEVKRLGADANNQPHQSRIMNMRAVFDGYDDVLNKLNDILADRLFKRAAVNAANAASVSEQPKPSDEVQKILNLASICYAAYQAVRDTILQIKVETVKEPTFDNLGVNQLQELSASISKALNGEDSKSGLQWCLTQLVTLRATPRDIGLVETYIKQVNTDKAKIEAALAKKVQKNYKSPNDNSAHRAAQKDASGAIENLPGPKPRPNQSDKPADNPLFRMTDIESTESSEEDLGKVEDLTDEDTIFAILKNMFDSASAIKDEAGDDDWDLFIRENRLQTTSQQAQTILGLFNRGLGELNDNNDIDDEAKNKRILDAERFLRAAEELAEDLPDENEDKTELQRIIGEMQNALAAVKDKLAALPLARAEELNRQHHDSGNGLGAVFDNGKLQEVDFKKLKAMVDGAKLRLGESNLVPGKDIQTWTLQQIVEYLNKSESCPEAIKEFLNEHVLHIKRAEKELARRVKAADYFNIQIQKAFVEISGAVDDNIIALPDRVGNLYDLLDQRMTPIYPALLDPEKSKLEAMIRVMGLLARGPAILQGLDRDLAEIDENEGSKDPIKERIAAIKTRLSDLTDLKVQMAEALRSAGTTQDIQNAYLGKVDGYIKILQAQLEQAEADSNLVLLYLLKDRAQHLEDLHDDELGYDIDSGDLQNISDDELAENLANAEKRMGVSNLQALIDFFQDDLSDEKDEKQITHKKFREFLTQYAPEYLGEENLNLLSINELNLAQVLSRIINAYPDGVAPLEGKKYVFGIITQHLGDVIKARKELARRYQKKLLDKLLEIAYIRIENPLTEQNGIQGQYIDMIGEYKRFVGERSDDALKYHETSQIILPSFNKAIAVMQIFNTNWESLGDQVQGPEGIEEFEAIAQKALADIGQLRDAMVLQLTEAGLPEQKILSHPLIRAVDEIYLPWINNHIEDISRRKQEPQEKPLMTTDNALAYLERARAIWRNHQIHLGDICDNYKLDESGYETLQSYINEAKKNLGGKSDEDINATGLKQIFGVLSDDKNRAEVQEYFEKIDKDLEIAQIIADQRANEAELLVRAFHHAYDFGGENELPDPISQYQTLHGLHARRGERKYPMLDDDNNKLMRERLQVFASFMRAYELHNEIAHPSGDNGPDIHSVISQLQSICGEMIGLVDVNDPYFLRVKGYLDDLTNRVKPNDLIMALAQLTLANSNIFFGSYQEALGNLDNAKGSLVRLKTVITDGSPHYAEYQWAISEEAHLRGIIHAQLAEQNIVPDDDNNNDDSDGMDIVEAGSSYQPIVEEPSDIVEEWMRVARARYGTYDVEKAPFFNALSSPDSYVSPDQYANFLGFANEILTANNILDYEINRARAGLYQLHEDIRNQLKDLEYEHPHTKEIQFYIAKIENDMRLIQAFMAAFWVPNFDAYSDGLLQFEDLVNPRKYPDGEYPFDNNIVRNLREKLRQKGLEFQHQAGVLDYVDSLMEIARQRYIAYERAFEQNIVEHGIDNLQLSDINDYLDFANRILSFRDYNLGRMSAGLYQLREDVRYELRDLTYSDRRIEEIETYIRRIKNDMQLFEVYKHALKADNIGDYNGAYAHFEAIVDPNTYEDELYPYDNKIVDQLRQKLIEAGKKFQPSKPVKPAKIKYIFPDDDEKAKAQAANIAKMFVGNGREGLKGAREILRLNIDAMLYLLTQLNSDQQNNALNLLNGRIGHIQITAPGLRKFSLFIEKAIDFSSGNDANAFGVAMKRELITYLKRYLAIKATYGARNTEVTSTRRYQRLLELLEKNQNIDDLRDAVSNKDSVEWRMIEAVRKRTSPLKHERYVMDIVTKMETLKEMKENTPEFLQKQMDKAKQDLEANTSQAHVELKHEDYAILECKENVRYGSDNESEKQTVYKLSKKGITKNTYIDKWNAANRVNPLVVELNGKWYLVTSRLCETDKIKNGKKDRQPGYYKLELNNAKNRDDAVKIARALDESAIDARNDPNGERHTGISSEDFGFGQGDNADAKAKQGEVTRMIAEHIKVDVVNKQYNAPCIDAGSQDFDQEQQYERGGPAP